MTEIIIKMPNEFKSIMGEIDEPLYLETLREIARKKLKEKKNKLRELNRKIKRFETRYSKTFEEFSQALPNTPKAHSAWMEWTFLDATAKELQITIEKLEHLLSE